MNAEAVRLQESRDPKTPWKKWGPYLSERQWGTVREDYSEGGDAWDYFTHDQARSRAYRWGEDGLAGISDDQQRLCFALALWNGKDPILKERLFGLTNSEGNHGEDVKEYYFYLDSTPTHSYMKYLYKYPQARLPLRRPGRDQPPPRPRRVRVRAARHRRLRRGPLLRRVRRVRQGVARGHPDPDQRPQPRPGGGRAARPADALVPQPVVLARHRRPARRCRQVAGRRRERVVQAVDAELGERYLYCEGDVAAAVHRERDQHAADLRRARTARRTSRTASTTTSCTASDGPVNPEQTGTKAAAHYRLTVGPGECRTIRLRLTDVAPTASPRATATRRARSAAASTRSSRRGGREADEFYAAVTPPSLGRRRGQRHAAGPGRDALDQAVLPLRRRQVAGGARLRPVQGRRARPAPRNDHWHHMYNGDVISMPDKWEYPWYAAWDLAFHVLALTLVDPDFGKQQLKLMLRERYLHPNGQIPAYEWNFGDVNPPVHAWATIFTYRLEKAAAGRGRPGVAQELLPEAAAELHLVGQPQGPHRAGTSSRAASWAWTTSASSTAARPLPTGGYLEQADGTAWMALFCQNMLEIAVELAMTDPDYGEMALKFVEHFLWIASSMAHLGERHRACGTRRTASSTTSSGCPTAGRSGSRSGRWSACCRCARPPSSRGSLLAKYPELGERFRWFLESRPELSPTIHDPRQAGRGRPPARLHPRRDQAPPRPGEDARRERVPQPLRHPLAVALPRRPPLRHPRRRAGVPRRLPAGRVRHRHVRRQLELARARSGCRSTP